LTEQQRNELLPGLELAHQLIRPVLIHKPIEDRPRKKFQDVVEDAILVAHGVAPFSSPDDSQPTGTE
jgi:hypothetical protein